MIQLQHSVEAWLIALYCADYPAKEFVNAAYHLQPGTTSNVWQPLLKNWQMQLEFGPVTTLTTLILSRFKV